MSGNSDIDIDGGDSIDWEEAIAISDAVETARHPEHQQQQPPSTRVNNSATDEEILFLYDLLDTTQYILVNDNGQDIEDLGMRQSLRPAARTLFDQFRKRRGFLSVTDLTAPAGWCEVQYAYSLMGRRDLKPEKRPDKIITAAGTEIKVDKKLAVKHEKILEKGRQVHAVLEREVHPEQILVQTETKADRWGLRLLNQIVSLVTLRDTGKAREIPVFGFFDDVFVMGVMDEVERRSLPEVDSSTSTKDGTPATSNAKITDFFKPNLPTVQKPTHGYYLVDSKTRRIPTLPKKEYTTASRYQLMLYRYLFNKHATDSFDWTKFWSHVQLSPEDSLSSSFLQQTQAVCIGSNPEDMLHLDKIGQLADYLRDLHLEVGSLQEQLELVYRWRGSSASSPRRARKTLPRITRGSAVSSDANDSVLQAAVAASLNPQVVSGSSDKPIELEDDEGSSGNAAVDDSGMFVDGPAKGAVHQSSEQTPTAALAIASQNETAAATTPPASSDINAVTSSSTPMDVWEIANKAEMVREGVEGSIIGTEKFRYSEGEMMAYVKNTITFWNGREPKGVSLDETNKCRNCEYQDGCEWLSMKAEEHRLRARERRVAQEAKTKTRIDL